MLFELVAIEKNFATVDVLTKYCYNSLHDYH